MKSSLVALAFTLVAQTALAAGVPAPIDGTYDIHLYFGEEPYLDQITLVTQADQSITGTMHVPNDFDAKIENFKIDGIDNNKFSFEYIVPKNLSRPKDFRAKYEGRFYDEERAALIGFATIMDTGAFMASFVGHRVSSNNP